LCIIVHHFLHNLLFLALHFYKYCRFPAFKTNNCRHLFPADLAVIALFRQNQSSNAVGLVGPSY
jgi:hypothetical protein